MVKKNKIVIKKNKIIFYLFITTCLLLFLIVFSSKVLTIRSGQSPANNLDEGAEETVEKIEMERVMSEYLTAINEINQNFELYFVEFDTMIASGSTVSLEDKNIQIEKIKGLQPDLMALLVPSEYRKKHLDLVLLFSKIDEKSTNNETLLSHLRLILDKIKE